MALDLDRIAACVRYPDVDASRTVTKAALSDEYQSNPERICDDLTTVTDDPGNRMSERSNAFLVEPEQLRTLLTLAEQKTFTRTAEVLGVQQSAISHQVRRLEDRLGRKLFMRSNMGITLTSDGEALMIYARSMLQLDQTIRKHFAGPVLDAKLRIGLVEELTRTALPTVLWLFSRAHPALDFQIVSERPAGLIQGVKDGRLDAALVRHQGEIVDAEPIWADRFVWVGRSDVTFPVSDPVPLVLPPPPSPLRNMVLASLEAARRTWRVPFEGAGLVSLEAGLRSGLGVSAFPRSMERLGLVELGAEAGLPDLGDMQYALMQSKAPLSDALDAFCQVFRDAARLSFATSNLPVG